MMNTSTTSTGPSPTLSDSASPSPSAVARGVYIRDNINVEIASSISPTVLSLNLTALNVPPGNYHLVAVMTEPVYVTTSADFTVQQGGDNSCLTSISSSSSSLTSTSSSSSTSTVATDSSTITSSDASSATSISATPVAVGGVSDSQVNKGAIAGGVVAGVVALLAALVIYYFCVLRPQRSRTSGRSPNAARDGAFAPGGGAGAGRWGGLGSVDSHVPSSDPKTQKPYVHNQPSYGRPASQDDLRSHLSRTGSVQYGGYAGSPSEEKFAGSPSEEMVLATLPYRSPDLTAHANSNNGRTHSVSSDHSRRYSLQQQRISMEGQSPFASPTTPSPVALVRNSSSGGQNGQRKTARKPVPAYAGTSASPEETSPLSSSPSPLPPSSTPFADPVSVPGHYSTRADRDSSKSISSKKSRSKTKLRDKDGGSANSSNEEVAQELAHKSSFGPGGVEGKPLHYLIPDMPVGH
ncbi:hypothetical protein H0H93_009677 [Arthromyces matolae]|nr:hypothetical protein H0H93_009677 [Arthromyces matolae]